jgi:hypothetical protein
MIKYLFVEINFYFNQIFKRLRRKSLRKSYGKL